MLRAKFKEAPTFQLLLQRLRSALRVSTSLGFAPERLLCLFLVLALPPRCATRSSLFWGIEWWTEQIQLPVHRVFLF